MKKKIATVIPLQVVPFSDNSNPEPQKQVGCEFVSMVHPAVLLQSMSAAAQTSSMAKSKQ